MRILPAFREAELNRIRRKVTMVFQSGALFDSLTVAENVSFSLELREDYDAQNKDDVVAGLLKLVDLWDARDSYPGDLSTGYRRAVAIARALAAQPQCILYDEPTTMVDPIMSDHLTELMLRLKKELKLTSVVVTHDLDLLNRVADKVVFLDKGRVAFFGPPRELYQSEEPIIQEFLELDKVIRGGKLAEDDPFRSGSPARRSRSLMERLMDPTDIARHRQVLEPGPAAADRHLRRISAWVTASTRCSTPAGCDMFSSRWARSRDSSS